MSRLQQVLAGFPGLFRVSVLAVLLLGSCLYTRAQNFEARDYRVGASTNLLYDAAYVPGYGFTSIPSVSLEFYPKTGRWTFGFDVEWPMWNHPDTHRYLQINNLTAWTRCYFKNADAPRIHGWYALVSVNAARYGIGLKSARGWEGEGLGASLGVGHKWALGRHFTLDLGLALGVFYSGYDPYVWGDDATGWYYYDYEGDPAAFKKRNQRLLWWGPTRIYLNIGFDFWSRKRTGRADAQ